MDRSVIFLSFEQASPALTGEWNRPVLDLLIESRAPFMSEAQSACIEFIEWCIEEDSATFQDFILKNLPGLPWADSTWNPLSWKKKFLEECNEWDASPIIVDLEANQIVCGGEILWTEATVVRWQGRQPSVEHPFHEGWIGMDLGKARPCTGTYDCYSLNSLPPLHPSDFAELQWLEPLPGNVPELPSYENVLNSLESLLKAEPTLPADFVTLFQHPEYLRRFRSATDCYFFLDSNAVLIPETNWKLVRFLADSQDCFHWSLMFSEHVDHHYVVATQIYTGSTQSNVIGPKLYPQYAPDTTTPLVEDITICARDFSEFLFRWWVENELWFAIHHQEMLKDSSRDYLAHYEKDDQ